MLWELTKKVYFMVNWFKKAFHKENSIQGATIILVVTLVVSNILGMLRDHFLAGQVSTYYLDTYYAAFKIPDLIFNLLILGAVSSVFIPVFTEKISRGEKKRALEIANRLLTATLVFTGLFALILYVLMPYLIPLLVPKFNADRMNLTTTISRILMITPLFFSMSYTVSGMLNSYKRFFAYSLAPLIYNLAIIFGALVIAPRFGIIGVAWTVVLGALLHFLIQYPAAVKIGFRLRFSSFWHDPDLKRIFYLMIPRSIGLGTNQITLLAFTAIASALAAGSIAVYTFADNIQTMPVVVFGTSLATVLFPILAESAALNNQENFSKYFVRAFKAIVLIIMPTAVIIFLLANPIIRLILGNGEFNLFDTSRSADTLAVFSVAIVFESVLSLLVRAFFAQKNTKLPMYASIWAMIIAIGLGYAFSRNFGVAGLAMGIVFGNLFSVCYLFYFFNKKFSSLPARELAIFTLKVVGASSVTAVITYYSRQFTGQILDLHYFVGVFWQAVISVIMGVLSFIIMAKIFKLEELNLVIKNLFAKYQGFTQSAEKEIERLQ